MHDAKHKPFIFFSLCSLWPSAMLVVSCAPRAETIHGVSQQGAVNVGQVVPQIAGVRQQHEFSDERIQHAVADAVDQRTQNVWNDVRPWILGAVGMVGIIAAGVVTVLVVWIRWNSYARQKPTYERGRARRMANGPLERRTI